MKFTDRVKIAFSNTAFENYVKSWYTGDDVNSPMGALTQEMALRYSAFFACNRVLAETFASVPIKEYREDDDGDRQATDDTGLLPILNYMPNDETSSYNFQEAMMYQLNLGGNFVAERLMGNNGRIAGLSQIPYQYYDILRDPNTGKIMYRVHGGADAKTLDTTKMQTLSRDQVLHVPGPSMNGIIGMSVLSYAASTIRLGTTYDTFGQKFYENGATPSGMFHTDKSYKDEAYNRLKADLKTNYTGLMNAGNPMLLEDGLKYESLTINPIDAELLNSRKFQIEDICRFFRVQPHMIQHLDKATNNNIEQQSLEFVMYTMLPHFKRVEDNINTQLLTSRQHQNGYYFEFNMASLLRGDQESMAKSFSTGIQNGYFSPNDVRRMLNLNKVEGGDTYLQPLNMVPLGTEPEQNSSNNSVDNAVENKVKHIMDEAAKKGTL